MTRSSRQSIRGPERLVLALALFAAVAPVLSETAPALDEIEPGDGGGSGYPTVTFHYSFVPFDRSCTDLTGFEIEPAWIDELTERIDFFREYWGREGPRLLETLVADTGTPFRQREMIATLTLCNFRSMSHPLLLNMRRFLASATDGSPRSLSMFGALVFHELLHTYVVDNLENSPLIEKYSEEEGSVRSHLHLLALLKKTYLKLGRTEELAEIVARDTKIGPVYARAWEIVNDVEGHEAFVNELRRRP